MWGAGPRSLAAWGYRIICSQLSDFLKRTLELKVRDERMGTGLSVESVRRADEGERGVHSGGGQDKPCGSAYARSRAQDGFYHAEPERHNYICPRKGETTATLHDKEGDSPFFLFILDQAVRMLQRSSVRSPST